MSANRVKTFWAICLLGMATALLAEHFSYDAGDIEGTRTAEGGITYTLSVTKGNLNTTYDFDTRPGVTSGAPTGINISVSSGGATGTVGYGADSLPTADFTISMNGKLIPPGEGEGPQPTWSASGTAKAPFRIQSNQSGGAKVITVPAGTSVTYTAKEGSSTVSADWEVNDEPKNGAPSIIFSRSWWNVPGWFDASMGTPKPGEYIIKAKPAGTGAWRDNGKMTVVGVKSISGGGKTSTKSSASELTNAETITVDASENGTVVLTAAIDPSGSWPSGTPEWSASCGSFCILGDHFIGNPDGQATATIDTSSSGIIVVRAQCGSSEKYIKVNIHEVEIECPAGILRDGQSGNNDNTIKIKAELNKSYIVKIERVSGSAGSAEFSSHASTLSYTGEGFDAWDEVFVNGLQESDTASNIKISINYNNQEVASDNTIVYSRVINTFNSGKLQRKDTNEQCDSCANLGQLLYVGHYTKGEHEEDSDRMYCNHCRKCCARACLASIKGGTQDSYRVIGSLNVTGNHDKGMDQYDIAQYMTEFASNYESVYQFVKQNTNMLAAFNNHAYIIYGVEKNTSTGAINNGRIHTWEPSSGSFQNWDVNRILHCFK